MFASLLPFLVSLSLIRFIATETYTCDPTASCGCTISTVSTSARIVGGEQAPNGAWGWMLSLQYNGKHFCGAVLISADFAVTSAHCLSSSTENLRNYTIVAGTNYLDDTSAKVQRRRILAAYAYPAFNRSAFWNDLALLRFAPLTTGSNSGVSFICRGSQGENVFTVGQNLVAIGWGVESYGSIVVPNALRQVTLQAMDANSADCRNVNLRDPVTRFCAGVSGGGKDTCQGDSGGPLMSFYNNRWYFAGTPSSGKGCARAGYPGIYTRVTQFDSYVETVLANPNNSTLITYSAYSSEYINVNGSATTSLSGIIFTTSKKNAGSRLVLTSPLLFILFSMFLILF